MCVYVKKKPTTLAHKIMSVLEKFTILLCVVGSSIPRYCVYRKTNLNSSYGV